jgi:hypothetical protein
MNTGFVNAICADFLDRLSILFPIDPLLSDAADERHSTRANDMIIGESRWPTWDRRLGAVPR